MDTIDLIKIYIITFVLSMLLLCIVCLNQLSLMDQVWSYSALCTQLFFSVALQTKKKFVLDVIHYLIFVYPLMAIFTNNIGIKSASLLLLIIIQVLWVREKKCILNDGDEFGYGDVLNICLVVYTPMLAFEIGSDMNYML